MLSLIDGFLNRVTMYRLVLYETIVLLIAAAVLGGLGMIPVAPGMLLFSVVFITLLCYASNVVFSMIFKAPVNAESFLITALILALIITPAQSLGDGVFLEIAFWASVWSEASKYIVAVRSKHLFNPAAFGVAVTALTLGNSASWWVGTLPLLPLTLIGGLLIVRKIRRSDLFFGFLIVALFAILLPRFTAPGMLSTVLWKILANTPILFFSTVMLTEPLTTPPTRAGRIAYGALTGLLYAPWMHVGSLFFTPELALLGGNVFSFLVSPKERLILTLKEKRNVADGIVDFWFAADRTMGFRPGQYLEWTLPHERIDSRGSRRTFTIASAPGEEGIGVGIRFYEPSSTFKKSLRDLNVGDTIAASQLAGDFTLPRNVREKLVFIAGGIGVTPFRSMVKDLLLRGEKRDIVLLYSNRTAADIAYREVFDEAVRRLGMKAIYTITDQKTFPADWKGSVGRVDAAMITREVPDFRDRTFYLSGTHAMVTGCRQMLRQMGVKRSRIVTDYFPGFA